MRALFTLTLAISAAASCSSNLDCSLNGICDGGACACDKPWGGPRCGVLQYKPNQPISAKNLYPLNSTDAPKSGPCVSANYTCDALNTWNGPIAEVDGKFHMFNPLYNKGSLLSTQALMHGVASDIMGPYEWTSMPDIHSNPAFVSFTDPADGKTKFTLWTAGKIRISESIDGPYEEAFKSPGGNPAPIFHQGQWYATTQRTHMIVTAKKLGDPWVDYANITVSLDKGVQEDPFMWVDGRGNWHVINHAYSTREVSECGNSTLSAHIFSGDNGKTWNILKNPNVEPYHHTVSYEDGTTHTYNTLERPNARINEKGQLTHLNLAADLMTQNGGCPDYDVCPARYEGKCACTNCKYADHAGSIIIALDV